MFWDEWYRKAIRTERQREKERKKKREKTRYDLINVSKAMCRIFIFRAPIIILLMKRSHFEENTTKNNENAAFDTQSQLTQFNFIMKNGSKYSNFMTILCQPYQIWRQNIFSTNLIYSK